MTAHKPATPLTWENFPDDAQENPYWHKFRISAGSAGVMEGAAHNRHGQGAQNAAYIAHAANAYPRLVAELKAACVWLPEDHSMQERITALLRELGEAE